MDTQKDSIVKNKISLNIKPVFKLIEINGKEIKIPKMGLQQHAILSTSESLEDGVKKLIKSIHPNLSVAERDLVCLHLLAFNKRIKNEIEIDGKTYSVDDVIICQQLKFNIGDTEYKFKSPTMEIKNPTIDMLLKDCCVSVKTNGIKQDIPDFMKMPAYVYKWVEKICNSISLKTHKKEIKGLYDLVELFDGS